MTGKERAGFRAAANSLEPEFHIGKGGVTDAVAAQALNSFNTKELIKVKVLLDSCPVPPREAAEKLAGATQSEVIQVIGGIIVLYKQNPNLGQGKAKAKKKKPASKQTKPLANVRAKRARAEKREAEKKLEKRKYYAKKRFSSSDSDKKGSFKK